MSAPRPASAPTEHANHDLLRVAEAADRGGRLPAELAACPDCTALHADLVALAAALPVVALPTRPRAYTLTAADAARLRPRGWRRWLGAIGSSRDVVTRPLAIGFTTLGLAGLLVATVPGALPGGGSTGGSAADTQRAAAPTELAATAPSGAPQLPAPAASAEIMAASEAPASEETDDGGVFSGVDATDAAATAPVGDAAAASAAPVPEAAVLDDTSGLSTLVVVAVVLMLAGLGLFGLRWTSRRLV